MSLKARIGKRAPAWMVRAYRRLATGREFLLDYRDYSVSTAWHMGSGRRDVRRDEVEVLNSRLTLAYHGIEKGATFPNLKRPYGLTKIVDIDRLLSIASDADVDLSSRVYALDAVQALSAYNDDGEISAIVTPYGTSEIVDYGSDAVRVFAESRNSVRNFDVTRALPSDLVAEIVRAASTTPSVCNRRSYRAHYYDKRDDIDSLLSLQNGNTGFGHTVPGLFVITERRSAFVGAGERNQRWIDGGLFAMSIVWISHARGLGSCLLNWSQTNAQTKLLRRAGEIGDDEDIIVLIAVGYPAAGHRVARSPLRAELDTFVEHG